MLNFETLMKISPKIGYNSIALDENNDIALELLSDGITAVVFCRNRGELHRFKRESCFAGGHWSDIDIDEALNGTEF